jgi:hypothetical protein
MEDYTNTKKIALLVGVATVVFSILYLVIAVAPLIRINGYITGEIGVFSYHLKYSFTGREIHLPNMDRLVVMRTFLVVYLFVLAGTSIVSLLISSRSPLDSMGLSFGVNTSLIIISGVVRMLMDAIRYDLAIYAKLLQNKIVFTTLAGVVVTRGSNIEYSPLYLLVNKMVPLVSQPLLILAPLILLLSFITIVGKKKLELTTTSAKRIGSLMILGLLILSLGYSAVFSYSPLECSINAVSPPVRFVQPSSSSVSPTISANGTSASVKVTETNTAQIVSNPDFYDNPDNWFFYSPNNYLSAYWLSSDTGASGGVVQIYGDEPAGVDDYGLILQTVTLPSATITSITIYSTLRIANAPLLSSYEYIIGLYDPDTNTWVDYVTGTPSSSYQTYSLSINPSSVTPGKSYYVAVGVIISTSSWFSGTLDFRIDSVYMYVQTQEYTFSGSSIDVNSTINAYGKLVIVSYSGNMTSLNTNISIRNFNGQSSTPIRIENGVITVSETNWTSIPTVPSGYHSASIYVSSESTNTVNVTFYMYLVVSTSGPGSGALAYYPLTLTVDPSHGVIVHMGTHHKNRCGKINIRIGYLRVIHVRR